jgi:hypothetical protein
MTRVANMYAEYRSGAPLAEVGRGRGITRQRVQQLFDDAGLPRRSLTEARDARRQRMRKRVQAALPVVEDARQRGKSDRDIARQVGVTLEILREVSGAP